ncbi:uncharacterized protein LOC135836954 [Planococcus citri]|uniref:uncharacterized protein LOC135836954 n=1 Tax=Planococcus citri TaxID=170843 RepID=UPI0031F8AEAA
MFSFVRLPFRYSYSDQFYAKMANILLPPPIRVPEPELVFTYMDAICEKCHASMLYITPEPLPEANFDTGIVNGNKPMIIGSCGHVYHAACLLDRFCETRKFDDENEIWGRCSLPSCTTPFLLENIRTLELSTIVRRFEEPANMRVSRLEMNQQLQTALRTTEITKNRIETLHQQLIQTEANCKCKVETMDQQLKWYREQFRITNEELRRYRQSGRTPADLLRLENIDVDTTVSTSMAQSAATYSSSINSVITNVTTTPSVQTPSFVNFSFTNIPTTNTASSSTPICSTLSVNRPPGLRALTVAPPANHSTQFQPQSTAEMNRFWNPQAPSDRLRSYFRSSNGNTKFLFNAKQQVRNRTPTPPAPTPNEPKVDASVAATTVATTNVTPSVSTNKTTSTTKTTSIATSKTATKTTMSSTSSPSTSKKTVATYSKSSAAKSTSTTTTSVHSSPKMSPATVKKQNLKSTNDTKFDKPKASSSPKPDRSRSTVSNEKSKASSSTKSNSNTYATATKNSGDFKPKSSNSRSINEHRTHSSRNENSKGDYRSSSSNRNRSREKTSAEYLEEIDRIFQNRKSNSHDRRDSSKENREYRDDRSRNERRSTDRRKADGTYVPKTSSTPKETYSRQANDYRRDSPLDGQYPENRHPGYDQRRTNYDTYQSSYDNRYIANRSRMTNEQSRNSQAPSIRQSTPQRTLNSTASSGTPSPNKQVRVRGTHANVQKYRNRYLIRFGAESVELAPWHPNNSYPLQFTAIAREIGVEKFAVSIAAHNMPIVGDGHAVGLTRFIIRKETYADDIDTETLRYNMSIIDLITIFEKFKKAPKRLMVSIGNFDVFMRMPIDIFRKHFTTFLNTVMSYGAEEILFLPLIKYPEQDAHFFDEITDVISANWDGLSNGTMKVKVIPPFPKNTPQLERVRVSVMGPFYAEEYYEQQAQFIRENYVPVPINMAKKHGLVQPPYVNIPPSTASHFGILPVENSESSIDQNLQAKIDARVESLFSNESTTTEAKPVEEQKLSSSQPTLTNEPISTISTNVESMITSPIQSEHVSDVEMEEKAYFESGDLNMETEYINPLDLSDGSLPHDIHREGELERMKLINENQNVINAEISSDTSSNNEENLENSRKQFNHDMRNRLHKSYLEHLTSTQQDIENTRKIITRVTEYTEAVNANSNKVAQAIEELQNANSCDALNLTLTNASSKNSSRSSSKSRSERNADETSVSSNQDFKAPDSVNPKKSVKKSKKSKKSPVRSSPRLSHKKEKLTLEEEALQIAANRTARLPGFAALSDTSVSDDLNLFSTTVDLTAPATVSYASASTDEESSLTDDRNLSLKAIQESSTVPDTDTNSISQPEELSSSEILQPPIIPAPTETLSPIKETVTAEQGKKKKSFFKGWLM